MRLDRAGAGGAGDVQHRDVEQRGALGLQGGDSAHRRHDAGQGVGDRVADGDEVIAFAHDETGTRGHVVAETHAVGVATAGGDREPDGAFRHDLLGRESPLTQRARPR